MRQHVRPANLVTSVSICAGFLALVATSSQLALATALVFLVRLTPEQWAERFDGEEWSLGDRNAIFAAALAPNMASCPPERHGRCFSEGRRERTRRLRCPRVATGRGCGRACHERRVPDQPMPVQVLVRGEVRDPPPLRVRPPRATEGGCSPP